MLRRPKRLHPAAASALGDEENRERQGMGGGRPAV